MTHSAKALLLGAAVLGVLVLAAPASRAAGIPAGAIGVKAAAPDLVTSVYYRRWHRRYRPVDGTHIVVQARRSLGFHDPGYAYHGNINGCAVDLGYGRYEPCNGR
jgi:hypothetical protein